MNHIKIYISLFLILFTNKSINAQNKTISEFNDLVLSNIPENVNIIGLGDPTHQESTITKYRVDLIKKLVEEKNFSIIAIEGNFYELYKAYQKFIQTNDFFYIENAMYSQLNITEMNELYQFVFEKNQKGDSIIITGFDSAFSGNTFTQHVKDELINIDFLSENEKQDFINELEKATITNLKALFRNNKNIFSKIVYYSELILSKYKPKSNSDFFFEQTLKNFILYNNNQNENSSNLRDIAMGSNILFLNKLYPNQKIILFGSSTHLLKNPKEINSSFFQNDRKTLGDFLDFYYHDNYYFLGYSGISGEKLNTFFRPKKLPELNVKSIEYENKNSNLPLFLNKANSIQDKTFCRFLGHSFLEMSIWKVMDGLVLIENIEPAEIK